MTHNTEEVRMKTIVVPLDGSAIAEQVMPHVQRLASMLAARVRLIRVVSEEEVAHLLTHNGALAHELGVRSPIEGADIQRVGDLLREHAADYLAARAAQLREAGVEVEGLVHDGSPAEQIIGAAERDRETLIAMVTHGYSGLRRWTLGSVADKVLHAATTPIYLVRATAQAPASVRPWQRILAPLDGSTLAEQALPLAIELAHGAPAELILLDVVVPPIEYTPGLSPFNQPIVLSFTIPDVLREQAQQRLAATINRFGTPEVKMTPVVMMGYPAETIVDAAIGRQADLIVMATHGYSGLRRWALGSVADKVLHASPVPLLLVRAQPSQVEPH
jgi:nucleotide-binding universal stress UspA family protein